MHLSITILQTQKICLKEELFLIARNTTEPPRRLLSDCLSLSMLSASPLIPSYNSLQRNVKMIQQQNYLSPHYSVRCSTLYHPRAM
ncbi:hypothetical protein HZS_2895 [Henneguya salminicola]|nr:hypothetical protein HZS_2895 [Henneguya salminicola]